VSRRRIEPTLPQLQALVRVRLASQQREATRRDIDVELAAIRAERLQEVDDKLAATVHRAHELGLSNTQIAEDGLGVKDHKKVSRWLAKYEGKN
jgi:hypothetical protein